MRDRFRVWPPPQPPPQRATRRPDAVLRPPEPQLRGAGSTVQELLGPPSSPPSLWLSSSAEAARAVATVPAHHPEFADMWWRYPWLCGVDANVSSFRFKRNYKFLESIARS